MKRLGSSVNSLKNPYAKNDFMGTPSIRYTQALMRPKGKTLPLMTDQEWKEFCKKRKLKAH